jgi:hypothetical protein
VIYLYVILATTIAATGGLGATSIALFNEVKEKKAELAEASALLAQTREQVASVAEAYHERIQIQESIVADRDKANEVLARIVKDAHLKLRTVKVDQCFDRQLPNDAIVGLFDAYKALSFMSGSNRMSDHTIDTYDTSTVTGRWVATFAINSAEALVACGKQLEAINSYNNYIKEFNTRVRDGNNYPTLK